MVQDLEKWKKEFEEKWEKLTLADNFIFSRVMKNHPEELKHLLENLLNVKIQRIESSDEQPVNASMEFMPLRMDVFVKDSFGRTFDVELQTINTGDLPLRSRCYQGIMDVNGLKARKKYGDMNDSYVIFLCMDDIFGAGLPIYSFQNYCIQDKEICLGDRSFKLFFNANNCEKMTNEEQKAFFNLLKNNNPVNAYTEKLKNYVKEVKMNELWKNEYMEGGREIDSISKT